MIKSMTGYAQASYIKNMINIEIEIRSYNSRYLDIVLYIPNKYIMFEHGIKKIIKKNVSRGRIEIHVSIKDDSQESFLFEVDEKKLKAYYKALSFIKKFLSIKSEITLDHLLDTKDIIKPQKEKMDSELIENNISITVFKALESLNKMREKEGSNLLKNINKGILIIKNKLEIIEQYADTIPKIYKKRLKDKILSLTQGIEELDDIRIYQEAAILAEKSDISEEIIRSYSHIKQFREVFSSKESQGKKLNFLIQELNREFNTMGSKAGKAELCHTVVDLKTELEKIREQIQNIE
ncbi:MAG: YicC family protein [Desulfobacteraceae bacterium 4572_130]|nr:MAG: YicC family protein [Desulfobacteraceae bacterium 4572_130]